MAEPDVTEHVHIALDAGYSGFTGENALKGDLERIKGHFAELWKQGAAGKAKLMTDVGMGVGGVGLGLGAVAVKEAVGVEDASRRVQAVYQVNQKAMGAYSQYIQSHSADLLQSQKDMYAGLGQIMQQFGGNVSKDFAEKVLAGGAKVATVFDTTLPNALKPTMLALQNFHESVGKTFDVMTKAASMMPGGWQALTSGPTQKTFALAAQSGLSLQNLMGADVTLARETGGGRAMSYLGTLLQHLSVLPGGQADLHNLGLTGTLQGLFGQYANDPSGLSKILGGTSGISYARLIASGSGQTAGQLGKSSGYLDTSFGQVSKDTANQYKQMTLAIEDDEVAIGRGLIPILKQFTTSIMPIITGVSTWVQHNTVLVDSFIKGAVIIGGTSLALRTLWSIFDIGKRSVMALRDAYGWLHDKLTSASSATDQMANRTLPNMQKQVQTSEQTVDRFSNTTMPTMNKQVVTSGATVDRFGTNNLGTLNKNIVVSGQTVDHFGTTNLANLDRNVTTAGTTVDTFGKTNLANLDRAIVTSGTTVDTFSTVHMVHFDDAMVLAGNEAEATAAKIGVAGGGSGLIGALSALGAAVYAIGALALEVTGIVLAGSAITSMLEPAWNGIGNMLNKIPGMSAIDNPNNPVGWFFGTTYNIGGNGISFKTPGGSSKSSGSTSFSTKSNIFQAVGGSSYYVPQGSAFGFGGSVSSNIVNNSDASMLSAAGVNYTGPIYDTDIPGGASPVMLPGNKGMVYRLVAQWQNGDYGGVEVWQAPNGGKITLMHLSELSSIGVGGTAVGGTTVGMSGAPLTNKYGNTPGFYHLCLITDAKGRSFLAYLNDQQIKTTPGAVALDSSTENKMYPGYSPPNTGNAAASSGSAFIPSAYVPLSPISTSTSTPVDHTGQPGWIMDSNGKWKHISPPNTSQKWTWTGSSWMLSATYTAIQNNQNWQHAQALQQHGLEWAYPSGMNLSNLPKGMSVNQWLTAQYKINELKRQEYDETARIAELRGQITKNELTAILAEDNQAKNYANQQARAKAHAVGSGSGGSAGVARVRIDGRCEEESKANQLRQAAADTAKEGVTVGKATHDVQSQILSTLTSILHALQHGQAYSLGEGAAGMGAAAARMLPAHGG